MDPYVHSSAHHAQSPSTSSRPNIGAPEMMRKYTGGSVNSDGGEATGNEELGYAPTSAPSARGSSHALRNDTTAALGELFGT